MRARVYERLSLIAVILVCVTFVCVAANGLVATAAVEHVFTEDNTEHVVFLRDNLALNLLVLFFCMALFALLVKWSVPLRAQTIATVCMLSLVCGLGVWWVGAAKALPGADALFILDHARALAAGNTAALAGSRYLRLYPFQTGFLLYCTVCIRVFGNFALRGMQYLNVVYVAASYLALILIARELFSDSRVTLLTTLLLCLCWQPLFLCTFVYGVLPGLVLALWGIYCVVRALKTHRIGWTVLAVCLIALAVVIKKNYAIVAIACGIAYALEALRTGKLRTLIGCTALIVCVAFAPAAAQSYVEQRAQTAFGPGMPQSAWLLMGIGESSMCSGWHNAQYANDFEAADYDPVKAEAQYRAQIVSRARLLLSRPRYLGAFFYHKLTSQWNEPAFQSVWSSAAGEHDGTVSPAAEALYNGAAGRGLQQYFDFYTQLIYVGFAAYAILLCGKKRRSPQRLILPLVLLGAFAYHALFEAKSQYALPYLPMMTPIAAAGLAACAQSLAQRIFRIRTHKG